MNIKWNDYFMGMIDNVSMKSKDKHTKVGAIITGSDNEIRSTGFNSFVRGMNDDIPERQERPEKYWWIEHAERNAIYNAARIGTSLNNCTIYISFLPCMDCARAIVSVGIKTIIISHAENLKFIERTSSYKEHIPRVYQLFKECGIDVIEL